MFFNIKNLIKKHKIILDILNDSENNAKFVGGCVRDCLLTGKIVEDIDISTVLSPDEVINKLNIYKKDHKNEKITILDKDKKYGTIIAIFDKQKYEITTTRADIDCFGRKANVKFCKSFKDDSNRRDFTINALYVDVNGKIYDYHNGLKDLQNKKIMFIGDPDVRIKEDYLRIIRYIRFATKFNSFNFDKNIIRIISNNKNGLLNLSKERIRSEIYKILEYNNWFKGLKIFEKLNILQEVVSVNKYTINSKAKKLITNNVAKLFYFFNYDKVLMERLKISLRFTKEEQKFCDFLTEIYDYIINNGVNIDVKLKIFDLKNEYKEQYIKNLISIINNQKNKNEIMHFLKNEKKMPISPIELIKIGYKDKNLGDKLQELKIKWINSNFTLSKNKLLSL